ncbi:MAG TPA: sigma factor [Puia sp.]|nr:sigma factor [Puia sp.]
MVPFDTYDIQNRLLADDHTALKALYEHYGPKLFQLAFAIVRSKETAEEVVEDVFIKVWKKRVQLGKLDNFTFYLYVTEKAISGMLRGISALSFCNSAW